MHSCWLFNIAFYNGLSSSTLIIFLLCTIQPCILTLERLCGVQYPLPCSLSLIPQSSSSGISNEIFLTQVTEASLSASLPETGLSLTNSSQGNLELQYIITPNHPVTFSIFLLFYYYLKVFSNTTTNPLSQTFWDRLHEPFPLFTSIKGHLLSNVKHYYILLNCLHPSSFSLSLVPIVPLTKIQLLFLIDMLIGLTKRFSLISSSIGATSDYLWMHSFLIWYLNALPLIHLHILNSTTFIFEPNFLICPTFSTMKHNKSYSYSIEFSLQLREYNMIT